MEFEEAKATIVDLLRERGRAKNSEMIAAVGNDSDLYEQVREDLIFEDLAEDKKGVGLVYIGPPAVASSDHDELRTDSRRRPPAEEPIPDPTSASALQGVRLFLSYGRSDAEELARRLRSDLEERYGCEVWQDTREIRSGAPWEQQIEDGLRSAQLLVALLSPHAVRVSSDPTSPDSQDSVCLDELSFARFTQPPTPIVPAMAVPCEAPFTIFRLDYVDMCRWRKSEKQYQVGLQKLVESIDLALTGRVQYRQWDASLVPWDFAAFLNDKRKHFCGRDWLFREIDEWRTLKDERALLIKGDPGTGKSAIVAELVHRNPEGQVLAYHCCQSSLRQTLEPGRFVRSIAAMIASKLDSYAAQLQSPGVAEALHAQNCEEDPAGALEMGVLAPLERVQPPVGGQVRYILVDALDEAWSRRLESRGATIVDLLAECLERLPAWLRLVATSRKERAVLERLGGLRASEVDAQDPRNLEDVRRYIETRLGSGLLADRLRLSEIRLADAVRLLDEKSAGNFLYAQQALQGIERERHSLEHLDELPPGLFGLYREFCDRRFPRESQFAPAKRLLQAVVAAREPLTDEQLARFTGLDLEDDLAPILRQLGTYLPEREGRRLLYHKSFGDWLTDRTTRGSRYYVSPRGGHEMLAATGWAEYQGGVEGMSEYALAHLPRHLKAANRPTDLEALLTDARFLQIKLNALGPQALVEDYDLTEAESDEPLGLIRGAVMLSASALARDAAQLLPHLHGRLAGNCTAPVRRLLDCERLAGKSWLRPLFRCLRRPGGALVRTLEGHTSRVLGVVLHGDGRRAISASRDRTLKIWDLDSGECLQTLDGHTGYVNSVAILGKGRQIVSASDDGTLRFWDLDSGRCLRTLEGHAGSVNCVVVDRDGRRVVSASDDETLRVWEPESGECLLTLVSHTAGVNCVALDAAGRRAVSASWDETLKVWDLKAGECEQTLEGHGHSVMSVAMDASGRRAISASWDKTLKIWDLDSGQSLRTLEGHRGAVLSVALDTSGQRAVSASWDETIRVWDLESGRCTQALPGHAAAVEYLALDSLGQRAVSASRDRTLKVWDLDSGSRERAAAGHDSAVVCVALHPRRRRVVSASSDATLKVWDLNTGGCLQTLEGHGSGIESAAFDASGRQVVSASEAGTLKVWDLESGECLQTLSGHQGSVTSVALDPGRRRAVTASRDETLKVWDLESGACLRTLTGHVFGVECVALYAAGSRAVSGSLDDTVKVWDLETGDCLRTISGRELGVDCLAVHADGNWAISAWGGTPKIWDLETGECLRTLEGHDGRVTCVALDDEGRRAVSVSQDESLRVWDPRTGREIASFRAEARLECCVVSSDGTVVAGDVDGRLISLSLEEG